MDLLNRVRGKLGASAITTSGRCAGRETLFVYFMPESGEFCIPEAVEAVMKHLQALGLHEPRKELTVTCPLCEDQVELPQGLEVAWFHSGAHKEQNRGRYGRTRENVLASASDPKPWERRSRFADFVAGIGSALCIFPADEDVETAPVRVTDKERVLADWCAVVRDFDETVKKVLTQSKKD